MREGRSERQRDGARRGRDADALVLLLVLGLRGGLLGRRRRRVLRVALLLVDLGEETKRRVEESLLLGLDVLGGDASLAGLSLGGAAGVDGAVRRCDGQTEADMRDVQLAELVDELLDGLNLGGVELSLELIER